MRTDLPFVSAKCSEGGLRPMARKSSVWLLDALDRDLALDAVGFIRWLATWHHEFLWCSCKKASLPSVL